MKSALFEIASVHQGDFRLTGNQNLIIANIQRLKSKNISGILKKYGIANNTKHSD